MNFRLPFFASAFLALSVLPAFAAQQFTYDVSVETKLPAGYKDAKGERKEATVEKRTDSWTVVIAPKWFSFSKDGSVRIYDFDNKRAIRMIEKDKTFETVDLHALVYFGIMELQNRQMLGDLLSKSGISSKGSKFGQESFFSMVVPGAAKSEIKEEKKGKTTDYIYKDQVVASVTTNDQVIDPANIKSFRHFMTYTCHLHPQILESLDANNNAISNVRVITDDSIDGGKSETADAKLIGSATVSDTMPSLDGFKETPAAVLVPLIEAVGKLGKDPKFPSGTDLEAFDQEAVKDGRPVDALLAICAQSWMNGDGAVKEMAVLKPTIANDSACKAVVAALGAPTKENIKDVEAGLQAIDRSKLKRAEVIDVILANDLNQVGRPGEAQKLMVSALTRNPLMCSAYMDLSQIFCAQFQTPLAWKSLELARQINPNYPRLAEMEKVDDKLERNFPRFF